MKKKIVLCTRRNVGLYSLSMLVAMGYDVSVISDDENVIWLAGVLGCRVVNFDTMGEFDVLLSVHWNKFIDVGHFEYGSAINIHPCLTWYKGKNPIKRYIANKGTEASIESHWMTNVVDEGELVHQEFFSTPVVKTYQEFYDIAAMYYFRCIEQTLRKVL